MADEDKTPETEEKTPDSIQAEVETAASAEGAGASVSGDERSEAGSTVDTPEETPAPAAAAPAASADEVGRGDERSEAVQEVLEPKERRARRAQTAKLRRAYRLRERTKAAEKRAAEPTPEPTASAGASSPASPRAPQHRTGRAKVRQGIVVSDKADKTIVVRVDVTRRHRRYGKIMRTSSKLHAHDERNDAGTGDTVRVIECRPMSRSKRWRLTDVLEKAK
jgi:small subunit ribosomal protein S17